MPTILGKLNLNAPVTAEKELKKLDKQIPEPSLLKKIFSRKDKPQDEEDKIGKQITELESKYKEDKKFIDKVSKVKEKYKKYYGKDPAVSEVPDYGGNMTENWDLCNKYLKKFEDILNGVTLRKKEYKEINDEVDSIEGNVSNNIKNIHINDDADLKKIMEEYKKELESQRKIINNYRIIEKSVSDLLDVKFELKMRRIEWEKASETIEKSCNNLNSVNFEDKNKKLDIKRLKEIVDGIVKSAKGREEFEKEFLELYVFDDNMGLPGDDEGRKYASKKLDDIKGRLKTTKGEKCANEVEKAPIKVFDVVNGKNVEKQYNHKNDGGPYYILVDSNGKKYEKYKHWVNHCVNRKERDQPAAENEATKVVRNLWQNRGEYK